jgi:hypothetical protein
MSDSWGRLDDVGAYELRCPLTFISAFTLPDEHTLGSIASSSGSLFGIFETRNGDTSTHQEVERLLVYFALLLLATGAAFPIVIISLSRVGLVRSSHVLY